MLFCQVLKAQKPSRSNLAKPQTFPLEKPRNSISGLRCSHAFWMSLYKDYITAGQGLLGLLIWNCSNLG